MYSKYFQLYEIVDRLVYDTLGVGAWELFPPESLEMIDGVREFFGVPCVCNNWFTGGEFQNRGYRSVSCTVGAKGSQHRLGRGFDLTVRNHTAEEARKKILANQDNSLLKDVTRMENLVNWLHIDCAILLPKKKGIILFNP